MAEKNGKESAQSCSVFVQEAQAKTKTISTQIQRLMDIYLEQDIDREEYRIRKSTLMSEKKTLEEKIINLEQKQNDWLEPPARREKGAHKYDRKWPKQAKKSMASPVFCTPNRRGNRNYSLSGAPDRIRTCGLWLRKPTLYPSELRALVIRVYFLWQPYFILMIALAHLFIS